MHMADALLSPAVAMTMNVVSAAAIGISVKKIKKNELGEKIIPLMGVAGAMVFAAQMVDITIPLTGSSGHLGGGILLAGLLGSIPAFLSMAAILIIQCLFFADGGLLALGSNIFVLGVVPCLLIYPLIFKPLIKAGLSYKRISVASIISAAAGLQLGAFIVVLLTLLSRITALPFGTFLVLMQPIHLVIGIFEGIITAAVLCFVYNMRPEIITSLRSDEGLDNISMKKILAAFAVLAVVIGGALSLLASEHPDGLEWSVEKTTARVFGIETELEAEGSIYENAESIQGQTAFLPDYAFASDPDNAFGTSLSGLIGAFITFLAAGLCGFVITKAKKS
ncbi:MAG: energy-coupling factor ABC transporter permease [Lachnospiraceae bacterium]|nr:energy-coupling factor ABC transporter permease [Lachnospiraceae bacterium]